MIVVYFEADSVDFEDATRFSTDEHNNLCIWGGRKTDELMAVFHPSRWRGVMVEHDDDQG